MTEIGEIRKGKDVGKSPSHYYKWTQCPDCKKERWVATYDHSIRCQHCATRTPEFRKNISEKLTGNYHGKRGNEHYLWRGGVRKHSGGYVIIKLFTNDFFYPTASKTGTILEHRLIMAQHIGRNLQLWEIVHHKNGIKNDNRIENLELDSRIEHIQAHSKGYRDGFAKGLQDGRLKQIANLNNKITEMKLKLDNTT